MLTFVAPIKEEEYILQWSYHGVPTRLFNNWEGHIGQISQGQWFKIYIKYIFSKIYIHKVKRIDTKLPVLEKTDRF